MLSGASISGSVLAFWLSRYGFDVTVVERAPQLRKAGGHAVDLFRPSMEISAKMGVLSKIEALATGTEILTWYREGARRPVRVNLAKIFGATSDQHVEIMRDDLSEIYYEASRHDTEYLFGDSITAISPDGRVSFEQAAPRCFDIVVGADGCTPTCGAWSSAKTPDTLNSSAGTSRWCRCRKDWHTTARWSVTSGPAGWQRSTPQRPRRRAPAVPVPHPGGTAIPLPRCLAAKGIIA
ncbi:FAD binding domain protein [Mycobacterium ulcerans str. Harvey]|uniref:FAD binding domain protein n=1 Tax=Mycobacterium ulcerans str. Harvey TaxID=1299332 RepID=A0ABN0R6X2_MYCUL|nr:FAD binding domain protein [Mycobacterium ulcerans str. Harvey]